MRARRIRGVAQVWVTVLVLAHAAAALGHGGRNNGSRSISGFVNSTSSSFANNNNARNTANNNNARNTANNNNVGIVSSIGFSGTAPQSLRNSSAHVNAINKYNSHKISEAHNRSSSVYPNRGGHNNNEHNSRQSKLLRELGLLPKHVNFFSTPTPQRILQRHALANDIYHAKVLINENGNIKYARLIIPKAGTITLPTASGGTQQTITLSGSPTLSSRGKTYFLINYQHGQIASAGYITQTEHKRVVRENAVKLYHQYRQGTANPYASMSDTALTKQYKYLMSLGFNHHQIPSPLLAHAPSKTVQQHDLAQNYRHLTQTQQVTVNFINYGHTTNPRFSSTTLPILPGNKIRIPFINHSSRQPMHLELNVHPHHRSITVQLPHNHVNIGNVPPGSQGISMRWHD